MCIDKALADYRPNNRSINGWLPINTKELILLSYSQILRQSPGKTSRPPRRRAPWRSVMCVVVGGRREHQRTPHGQLSDVRVVTRQMTVVEIIIADLRCLSNSGRGAMPAYVCWWMRSVPEIKSTCEMSRAVSAAEGLRNIDGKCRTAAPHKHNQGLIANLSYRVCPAQCGLWRDVTDVCPVPSVVCVRQ